MIKIFKRLSLKEWFFAFISFVFIVVQVWLDLKMPEYLSEITRLTQTQGHQLGEIWAVGVMMILCAVGSLVTAIIVGYFMAKIAALFSMELREDLFNKTLSFGAEEINNFSTSSLITRSTNDITQIQMLITTGFASIVKAPILAIWAFYKIMGKSWQFSAATGVAIVLITIVVLVLMLFAMPKYRKVQTLTDNLNRVTIESLTGLRVVRAYNAEKYQEEKFETVNKELTDTNFSASRIMSIMSPGMSLIMSGLSLSIYWIGAYLINSVEQAKKMVYFGDMVVFAAYAVQIVMAFMMLSRIFLFLPRITVSTRRVNEVLDMEPHMVDGNVDNMNGKPSCEVKFKDVSFKYPGGEDYVLQDISFTAKKGETVAFIGSTGSGKSTLVNLIPRFYDATAGEILVDGINVKDYKQAALNEKMGYVSQKAILFSGTVKTNVAYGKDEVIESDIESALDVAQGADFVEQMDGKFDAPISRGGINISGGQKQRLSIARAIHCKSEILIFDDSFSALDYKTDRQLRSALKKETKDSIVLIVAQRIGTIQDADRIIVLDEGKIVGMGKHDELMEACPIYQEIAYSQLSKEELKHA